MFFNKNNDFKRNTSLFCFFMFFRVLGKSAHRENSHPSSPPWKTPPGKFPTRKFPPRIFPPISLIALLHLTLRFDKYSQTLRLGNWGVREDSSPGRIQSAPLLQTQNFQQKNMLLISSLCATVSSITFILYNNTNLSNCFHFSGFHPNTFVYSRFPSMIQFLYCLLSSISPWRSPHGGYQSKTFWNTSLQFAGNAFPTLFSTTEA